MTDLLLMRTALREALRPRRLTIAVLLMVLPAVIGLLWRLLASPANFVATDVYDSLVVGLVFSFVLTIMAVTYGTGVVSQELEQRTIVYLLTRPLPRWRLLFGRYLVSAVVASGIAVVSALLLALAVFGPAKLGTADIGSDLTALTIGGFVYTSLFLLLGTAVPRSLTWGLMFVFDWETWVPKLPGSFALLSIMSYLRALASREISAAPSASTGDNFLLAFSRAPKVEIGSTQAWTTLILILAVCLIAAMAIFSTREYIPREDAE